MQNKIITTITLFIIPVIAIGLSIGALVLSRNANKQAIEANKLAEESLVVGQRPWLIVEPVKLPNKDSFIIAEEIDSGMRIKTRFKITNTGHSAAKKVKVGKLFNSSTETALDTTPVHTITYQRLVDVKPSGSVSLAPQESIFIDISSDFIAVNFNAIKDVIALIEEGHIFKPSSIEVFYEWGENTVRQGKVGLSYVISTDDVDIEYRIQD